MTTAIQKAIDERDEHIRRLMHWHFKEETGCAFWLERKQELNFDPLKEINGFDDLCEKFPLFDGDNYLRTVPADMWRPRGFGSCRWSMYQTGGTTGDPKLRWGRRGFEPNESDWAWDYHTFSGSLPEEGFPDGGAWLYIGPGGPRRLRYGVEVLANCRNAGYMIIDMDVAWMKAKANTCQKEYLAELVDRSIRAIRRNKPKSVFCPPVLIEAIGEEIDWAETSVTGIFAGGTEMDRETTRNIMERHLKGKIVFKPTYGNALAGLAICRKIATEATPVEGQDPYSIIYQPLQPRTLLRVVKRDNHRELVQFGERGRVVITTITNECFMPLFVERDEAGWIAPTEEYPWPGLSEVGPPEEDRATLVRGVY